MPWTRNPVPAVLATIATTCAAWSQSPVELDRTAVDLLSQDRYVAGPHAIPVRELDGDDLETLRRSLASTLRREVTAEEAREHAARFLAQARLRGSDWKLHTSFRTPPSEGKGLVGNHVDARLSRWMEADYPGFDTRLTQPRSKSSDAAMSEPGARQPLVLAQSKVGKEPSVAFRHSLDDVVAFGGNPLSRMGTNFEVYVTEETLDWATSRGLLDGEGRLRPDRAGRQLEERHAQLRKGTGGNARRASESDIGQFLDTESRVRFSSLGPYGELRSAATASRRSALGLKSELDGIARSSRATARVHRSSLGRAAGQGFAMFELSGAVRRLSEAASGDANLTGLEWASIGTDVAAGSAALADAFDSVRARGGPLGRIGGGGMWLFLAAGEGVQFARFATGEISGEEYGVHVLRSSTVVVFSIAGGWVGSVAFGAIGSFIGPVGTVVGLELGEVIGAWVTGELAGIAFDCLVEGPTGVPLRVRIWQRDQEDAAGETWPTDVSSPTAGVSGWTP